MSPAGRRPVEPLRAQQGVAPLAAAQASTAACLAGLLQDGARWDAEYAGSLSNHLPMALVALYRLGARAERLLAYASHYTQRLHPAPPIEPWPAGQAWRPPLGDPAAWPAYRSLFRQWLAAEGAATMLQQALPHLLPGCGAAAFHGLIRTAYAFESLQAGELADALAYWSCRWLDLGRAPPAPGRMVSDPARQLGALLALPTPDGDLIVHRMQAAAIEPGFDAAVAGLALDENTLERLARGAAQRYARSGNFTVLHLVTSAHALRLLLPFIDEPRPALAAYWRAYAAGVVASHAVSGRAASVLPWPELAAAACASDDDHLVKLVDACRQEQQAYGGAADWQRAASRAVLDARARGGATRPG